MSTDRFPAVDVVIATRDRPELLRQAISAVVAQEYPGDVRVLVVFDQASPDDSLTSDLAGRSVKVLTNARSAGLAGARNTGIQRSDAPLVAFCDDDDVWLPGKLQRQVSVLLDDADAVLVGCGIVIDYEGELTERTLASTTVSLDDLLGSRLTELHPSTFVMRRDLVVDVTGLVDENIPGGYAEDYEFLLRIARHADVRFDQQVGVRIRWHKQSYFAQRWATIAEALIWLLERYPEFSRASRGRSRILGQIAFALAAQRQTRQALSYSVKAISARWSQPRAYLAVAVALRLVTPDRVLRSLHDRGKGM